MLRLVLVVLSLLWSFSGAAASGRGLSKETLGPTKQTNVLYIIYDDLRPELSIYGKKHMVTPNFERLAKRSVVFDNAYCQISVCNPSRGSLLTGLRPDRVNMYAFQSDFRPNMGFPTKLAEAGYRTGGVGKILHWDDADPALWTHGHKYHADWYEYQNTEVGKYMNASTQPNKVWKEEDFRDYQMTTDSIKMMREMSESGDYFMMGIGYKLPHLALNVPYRHWDMYRKMDDVWKKTPIELSFPRESSPLGYRCCADANFQFLNEEGSKTSETNIRIGVDVHASLPQQMHNELMWAYSGAVSYMDDQLGRVLDEVDRLDLWHNLTIVLTADHGMHNGEKGMWEKWTLFDESTKVPLIIHHPESTMQGQHYAHPVELIDVFPTIVDLAHAPKPLYSKCTHGRDIVCKPLNGQSLAPVMFDRSHNASNVKLPKTFALSQSFRCASQADVASYPKARIRYLHPQRPIWVDCSESASSINKNTTLVTMGYSMRTKLYRYTAWYHFDEVKRQPFLSTPLVDEELYDHRGEDISSFGHRETQNLAQKISFVGVKRRLKERLDEYLLTLQQYPVVNR